MTVHQERVVGDVSEVHRRHQGFFAVEVSAELAGLPGAEEGLRRAFADGVPIAAALQRALDLARAFVRPVAEDDGFVMVGAHGGSLPRFDDDGAMDAALFLVRRVAVVPIGAVLLDDEFEDPRLTRADRRRREQRHAVFKVGDEQAMPVDGGFFVAQRIAYRDARHVAFAEAQDRAGARAVDGEDLHGLAGRREFLRPDCQGVGDDLCVGVGLRCLGGGFLGLEIGSAAQFTGRAQGRKKEKSQQSCPQGLPAA